MSRKKRSPRAYLFYDLEGGSGGADASRSIPSYPRT